jgi:hypothetical protein
MTHEALVRREKIIYEYATIEVEDDQMQIDDYQLLSARWIKAEPKDDTPIYKNYKIIREFYV